MKFNIDISVFIRSGGSFGHVSGTLELDILPLVGDTLSFAMPRDVSLRKPHTFLGHLKVEDRVFDVTGQVGASLMLGSAVGIARLLGYITVPGYAMTILTLSFFGGLNTFGLGLVGAYVWRAYENTKQRPLAIVQRAHDYTGTKAP